MMRKKIVSLCMALALCLSLLPVTALAADGGTVYVGGVMLSGSTDSPAYATTDDNGTVTIVDASADKYNIKWDGSTLTLDGAKIKGGTSSESLYATAGIYAFSNSGDVSLNIALKGVNEIFESSDGIWVYSSSYNAGAVTLTIEGEGSLNASGSSSGILVQSNNGNATLTIQNAEVTATSTVGVGVQVRSGAQKSASLTVDGGSLTATGKSDYGAGIRYTFGSSSFGSGTPSLTVSGNTIVRANGGIANNSSTSIQYGTGSDSTGGIVFDGKDGTVYGNVELRENLTIGEGETLTIPDGSSLNCNDNLTNNGTIIVEKGGNLTGDSGGTVVSAPTIGTQPASQTVTEGNTATFSVAATGEKLSYQWQQSTDNGQNWTDISEAKAATYTTAATTTSMNGYQYRCVVSNSAGSVTSNAATLTVNAATVSVTGVTLTPASLSLFTDDTATLTATVQPSDATNQNVTWSSDKPEVATVENGVVTAKAAGTATITVTTADGNKTATCAVTVTAATVPVTGVTLNKTSTSLYVGDTETLTATVEPSDATDKNVTWSSDNEGVATVDATGKVTAVSAGTATITVTTEDGAKTASCTVTVRPDIPPANPNYKITVEATQGGTVTADPTAAKAGATVTLTPVPDRGYQVGAVAVTDRFGDPVAVTEQADGTYTFTMPNGQVTVTVTFAETPLPFTDVMEGDWFYDAVVYAYETGLMDGVGDNLFAPNSETTRAQLVTILYRLAGQPAVSGDLPFPDVESGTWYTDAVAWAAQNGIVNGVSDTEFAPGDNITREQLAVILYRYAAYQGYDVSQRADLSGFGDAESISGYAQEALSWAHAQGLVLGFEDGSLRPQGTASRAQIAAVLMRFLAAVPTE